jgi:hypothetical protein
MSFRVVERGLIFVEYQEQEDLDPLKQGPLIEAVEGCCAQGPVAIVFQVSGARKVDIAVPEMWLKVTTRLSPALCAMAVASSSMVVRVAADAFGISNVLRRIPVVVKSFKDVELAALWAREHVATLKNRG